MNQDVYCVVGMHRSGTSAVAKALHRCGINMGEKLLGANKGNVFGHYEDVEFLNFQSTLLDRMNGRLRPDDSNSNIFFELPFDIEFTSEDFERAQRLIESRRPLERWGWKDPRSSLFLDFWIQNIPNLKVIVLFRHPLAVVDSLVRRGNNEIFLGIDFLVDNWCYYYQPILSALSGRANQCIVLESTAVLGGSSKFVRKLSLFANVEEASILGAIKDVEKQQNSRLSCLGEDFRLLRPDAGKIFEILEQQASSDEFCIAGNVEIPECAHTLTREFARIFGYSPAMRCYSEYFQSRRASRQSPWSFFFAR
jgi:hypothetical protein